MHDDRDDQRPRDAHEVGDSVQQPGEVLRVAAATRLVLDELRSDGLNDSARRRAQTVYEQSLDRLRALLSQGLADELCQLSATQTRSALPSAGELRVVEAQLVGWLDGLLKSLQASVAARAFEAQQVTDAQPGTGETAPGLAGSRRDPSYL